MKLTSHSVEFWGGPWHGTKLGPGEPFPTPGYVLYHLEVRLPCVSVYVARTGLSKSLRLFAHAHGWLMGYFLWTERLLEMQLSADADLQFVLSMTSLDFEICIDRLERLQKPRKRNTAA